MCVVSNITAPWADKYPNPFPPPDPWHPKAWPIPPIETIDPKVARQLLDVIERLEKIDKALGLLDCKIEKVAKQKIIGKLRKQAKLRGKV